jgi:pSer/pThr/pTyr-binding forkhead associated (FHA) protein
MQLVIVRGEGQGRIFKLEEGSNLIGRWDPDSGSFPEIDLEKEDLEAKISRKHAVIECKGGVVTVEDVGSRNGTFINRGPRLDPGVKHSLKIGDEVIVGKTFLRLESGD